MINANEFTSLLGITSDDQGAKELLKQFKITKEPKLKGDDFTAIVLNHSLGIEITFRDERFVEVSFQEYEEGALVLWNIRMYGPGHQLFKPFTGVLPFGLTFGMSRKEAGEKMGRKPAWESKDPAKARWDFEKHCAFLAFDKAKGLHIVSLQMPVGEL